MNRCSVVFAVALFVACGLASHAKEVTSRKADPDPARFDGEIARFAAYDRQNTAPTSAVLFVGSSSIRMWQTAESFPDLAVINRGFGGSQASDVNHFAERIVLKYAPRMIVYYAGDNDIADGKSPEQVAGDFERFVALVHAKLPDTEIIYLPVKPSLARWKLWPQMQETNALVKHFVEGHERLSYVNTATPMLGSGGQPRPELFLDDGLHMNAKGYAIWAELVGEQISNR